MGRLFALVGALVLLGCSTEEHTIIVRFDPPALGASVNQLELWVVERCEGQPFDEAGAAVRPKRKAVIDKGMKLGLGRVDAGDYGLYAVAIADGCRIGAGCTGISLGDGNSRNFVVVIQPAEDAVCELPPPDGSVDQDAGPDRDDAGRLPPTVELALSFESSVVDEMLTDESDNAFVGTLHGGAEIIEDDDRGSVLSVDGFEGVVEFGPVLPLTDKITVEAWVNPSIHTGWATIINRYLGNTGYWIGLSQDGTGVAFWVDVTFALRVGSIELGTWTHVAGTFDEVTGNMILYLNGNAAASANHRFPAGIAETPLSIGNRPSTVSTSDLFPFTGQIDDVRIFNEVRTPQQICGDVGGLWDGADCNAVGKDP